MTKKGSPRHIYTEELKAEAVALAHKREKPVTQITKDLGLRIERTKGQSSGWGY